MFQHTAARRRLQPQLGFYRGIGCVSTHSRPKAAAQALKLKVGNPTSFNTQPPEGGCFFYGDKFVGILAVSTHSRPKAAAIKNIDKVTTYGVSTHSRPKAAARFP